MFLCAAVVAKHRFDTTLNQTDQPPRIRVVCRNATIFVASVIVAVGPWLLKNAVATGNPVYPLAYSVFGANDWSPEMDAKWKTGHTAHEHDVSRIPHHLANLAVRNDWQNGFLFAFAVPALFLTRRKMTVTWLWLHALWLVATWWLLTHRIDRFWIPVIPLMAVLAGAAWTISSAAAWRYFLLAALSFCAGVQLWALPISEGHWFSRWPDETGNSA